MMIGKVPAERDLGSVITILDADDLAVAVAGPTRTVAPFRKRPRMVTRAPGDADAGETLVTRGEVPPAWNLGSLAGTRRTATTLPLDSVVDSMQGAGYFVPRHLWSRPMCTNAPCTFLKGPANDWKQTPKRLRVGSPSTVSVA